MTKIIKSDILIMGSRGCSQSCYRSSSPRLKGYDGYERKIRRVRGPYKVAEIAMWPMEKSIQKIIPPNILKISAELRHGWAMKG